MKSKRSLLARVILTNLVLLAATGVVIIAVFLWAMRSEVIQQMDLRAASLARTLASRAQFPMLVKDHDSLAALAKDTLRIEDVVFVVITDSDGSSVGLSANFRGVIPPGAWPEGASNTAGWSSPHLEGAGYIDAAHRVEPPDSLGLLGIEGSRPGAPPWLGSVRVGFSLQRARSDSLATGERALAVAALFLGLILIVQWRHLRRILIPVAKLVEFTSSVGQETLGRRAEIAGDDEVAQLAAGFNGMLDRLQATLVSKDLAEQANQAKGRFLATASHELRMPLNAIIGYSELIEEEMTDLGVTHSVPDLRKIRNSGQMLLELVNDLLDYSKAEAGRTQIEMQPLHVGPVMREVADAVAPLARANRNELSIQMADADPLVMADRFRLRQSLLNLAGNACKFTEGGIVTLSASVRGGTVRIDVRDTGIGMSREDVGKLFEAFVQVDSSVTRKYAGTGLGLAVSRKLCRLMSGDITVASEPGRGSVFTIVLPAAQESAALTEEVTESRQ